MPTLLGYVLSVFPVHYSWFSPFDAAPAVAFCTQEPGSAIVSLPQPSSALLFPSLLSFPFSRLFFFSSLLAPLIAETPCQCLSSLLPIGPALLFSPCEYPPLRLANKGPGRTPS